MTGKQALEAHRLMTAVAAAMKGRGDKVATADQFLMALHELGFDVTSMPSGKTVELQEAAE